MSIGCRWQHVVSRLAPQECQSFPGGERFWLITPPILLFREYAHTVEYTCQMPLSFCQVSIKEGRHFWLDLKGITVPPQSPMLYVPTGEKYSFHSLSIKPLFHSERQRPRTRQTSSWHTRHTDRFLRSQQRSYVVLFHGNNVGGVKLSACKRSIRSNMEDLCTSR